MIPLSVCIIGKNEEKILRDAWPLLYPMASRSSM